MPKAHFISRYLSDHYLTAKIGLVMKLTSVLILVACLQVSATGLSQTLNLKGNEIPLKRVFQKIERQTGYMFIYKSELLSKAKTVTINVSNATLEQVLEICFRGQPLSYKIFDKIIAVQPKAMGLSPTNDNSTQNFVEVTGRVIDAEGSPLIGANIKVKGTNQGTTTDENGMFTLKGLERSAILEISFVGYQTQEVPLSIGGPLTIQLKLASDVLGETIIIGYGTTTRRTSTGSQSGIKAAEIEKQPVTNVLSALEGRIAGLFISQTSGVAGGAMDVQIRGINSIAAGRNPLFIIDGVPFSGSPIDRDGGGGYFGSGINWGGNPLNTLNPSDIESLEVLKDADATAIYGSRGANGVILITTKRGKAGETKVDVNVSTGFGRVTHRLPMLDLKDYLQIRRQAFVNDGEIPDNSNAPDLLIWDTTRQTDWQKEMIGHSASFSDASVSLSGGTARDKYLIGATYHYETTVYPGSFHYQRGGLRFSSDHSSKNNKFGLSLMSIYNKDNNLMPAFIDPVAYYSLPPNFPAYTANGGFYYNSGFDNPYAWLKSRQTSNSDNIITNLTLRYSVLKGLDFKLSGGYNRMELRQTITRPKPVTGGTTNFAIFTNNDNQSFILEPQAHFKRDFGKSQLDLVAGGTYQHSDYKMPYYIFAFRFSSDDLLTNLASAGQIIQLINNFTSYKYASAFGRATYNWDNKYIVDASFRRDGSSRFAPLKRFGNFGAVGVAWIFTRERFLNSATSWLSYGKLRASYGTTGNDQISDYGYLQTYGSSTYPYGPTAGLTPTRIANPEYSWEVTKKLEAAMELAFLQNRILFNINYFRNRSNSMLVGTPLTPQTGFTSFQSNLPALIQNKGMELELNVKTMQRKTFTWNTSFNLTVLNSKLLDFPGLKNSSYRNQYAVGESLSIIPLYQYSGLKNGIPTVEDVDKNNSIVSGLAVNDGGDLVIAGQSAPYAYGGLTNTVQYRKWEFDVMFQFVKQDGLDPIYYTFGQIPGLTYNLDRRALTNGIQPTVVVGSPAYTAYDQYYTISTAMLQDASYIRLKNVSVVYNLLTDRMKAKGISAFKVFLRGQNLLTFTNYYGFDPETKNLSLPPLKTITAGIQFTL